MRKFIRIISILLVAVIALGLLTACIEDMPITGGSGSSGNSGSSNQPTSGTPVANVTGSNQSQIPTSIAPAVPIVLAPIASGINVESNEMASIDFSHKEDGYIMVQWLRETTMQLRVRVVGPTGVAYNYRLNPHGDFEVFPLSDGNGEYTVMVLEQVEGTQFAVSLSFTFDVELVDEFAPFLRPNQYVYFTENCNVVAVAAQVVAGQPTFLDKISAVYNFVARNITYDREFAQAVVDGIITGYIPDLDDVLARGYGICFDYAAVMTAMLRSQGIPTKMIFGYVGEVFHAWINVHSEDTGWINGIIQFDGEVWTLMDPTFESTAGNSAALQDFIGDGSGYYAKFLF